VGPGGCDGGVARFAPQFGQNLVPAGLSVPHWGQVAVVGAWREAPQLEQNFAVAAFCVPQLGQATTAPAGAGAGASVCPQLEQNLAFSEFSVPHLPQRTCTWPPAATV
jgi:hypothetical protein